MYNLFIANPDLKIKKTPCKGQPIVVYKGKMVFFLSVTHEDLNSRVGSNYGPNLYPDDDDDDDDDDNNADDDDEV